MFTHSANLQRFDERSQMESGFPRYVHGNAQDSWQFLTFEGQACSLRRAFTSSRRGFLVIGLKVRRNQPQSSKIGPKLRTILNLHVCWLLWTSVLRKQWMLRTDVPSAMPLQGREEHESLREPCDQIEELFRD